MPRPKNGIEHDVALQIYRSKQAFAKELGYEFLSDAVQDLGTKKFNKEYKSYIEKQ